MFLIIILGLVAALAVYKLRTFEREPMNFILLVLFFVTIIGIIISLLGFDFYGLFFLTLVSANYLMLILFLSVFLRHEPNSTTLLTSNFGLRAFRFWLLIFFFFLIYWIIIKTYNDYQFHYKKDVVIYYEDWFYLLALQNSFYTFRQNIILNVQTILNTGLDFLTWYNQFKRVGWFQKSTTISLIVWQSNIILYNFYNINKNYLNWLVKLLAYISILSLTYTFINEDINQLSFQLYNFLWQTFIYNKWITCGLILSLNISFLQKYTFLFGGGLKQKPINFLYRTSLAIFLINPTAVTFTALLILAGVIGSLVYLKKSN